MIIVFRISLSLTHSNQHCKYNIYIHSIKILPNIFIANKKILIGRALLGEDNSVQPVAAQGPLFGEMVGAEGFEEGVELGSVVGALQMAELV